MLVARTGDIALGTCVCVTYPQTPYPIAGVIGTGAPNFLTGGMAAALGNSTLVSFPCTTGPKTQMILAASVNTTNMLSWARLNDPIATGCVVGATIISATSTITSQT